jgi:hypothetical protein
MNTCLGINEIPIEGKVESCATVSTLSPHSRIAFTLYALHLPYMHFMCLIYIAYALHASPKSENVAHLPFSVVIFGTNWNAEAASLNMLSDHGRGEAHYQLN